jgi:hypothetical protein
MLTTRSEICKWHPSQRNPSLLFLARFLEEESIMLFANLLIRENPDSRCGDDIPKFSITTLKALLDSAYLLPRPAVQLQTVHLSF